MRNINSKNKTKRIFKEAEKIIPGGTQLFSKKPELFAPNEWPGYFLKAKGVYIWDLDNRKLLDMSIMNVGACILGYADDDVDNYVKKNISNGVSSTLNTVEEYKLAKLLLRIHPWAKKVRFARGGGEAMSVAIRIARSYSKKDKILFSGYHGWNDWYLSSNLKTKKNLNNFLIKGLIPKGVPKKLINTSIPFDDSDIISLEKKLDANKNKVAAVVIEPARGNSVNTQFLLKLKKIAKKYGAIVIFDEITSGFRMNVGGIHLSKNINPDIAVFAKSMSNGYAMSAIIGKKNVMNSAMNTFISSTNWTEKVGPSAAIATIQKCIKKNIFKHNIKVGIEMKKIWLRLSRKHNLKIQISGIDTLPSFNFTSKENQKMLTYFTREMLKYNILAFRQFRPSYAHRFKHLKIYESFADKVFHGISLNLHRKIKNKDISKKSFSRITKE